MISDELRKKRLQRAEEFARYLSTPPSQQISADELATRKAQADELAAITKKADDLDAAQKSVSDAAAVGAPLWLSYIFLLFYVAIAASAVTHKDLLLESPVELPFLNIKLPLKAFFIVAPVLFLIVHAYVMAHFAMLASKAKAFADLLKKKIGGDAADDHEIREALRRQLPINVFTQFLVGPSDVRHGAFSLLLWVVAWATLVAGPVAVLLLLQLQFLPYHATLVTCWHRIILILDLGFIWWLWMRILAKRDNSGAKREDWLSKVWDWFLRFSRNVLAAPLTAAIVGFSVLVATFPGEWEEEPYRWLRWSGPTGLTDYVFGKIDKRTDFDSLGVVVKRWNFETRGMLGDWPANALRLPEFDIYAALGVKGAKELEWKPFTFSLKDRHLKHADLRAARLDNLDLRKANLNGALLDYAKLRKANLDDAWLQDASLGGTQLQGASFNEAKLQNATLMWTQLQGASLKEAKLQGASLAWTQLQLASLHWAQLQGASLMQAQLQGASLYGAQLQGASLEWVQLQGASLEDAKLQGASLELPQLQGASLSGADLQGARLLSPFLWRADWGALNRGKLTSLTLKNALWRSFFVKLSIDRKNNLFPVVVLPVSVSLPFPELGKHWTDQTYADLKREIESIPEGEAPSDALDRIERLDCKKSGETLASCNPTADLPLRVKQWQETLDKASGDASMSLAATLRHLVCDGDKNAIYVLRGIDRNRSTFRSWSRLADTGAEAPALIDDIIAGKNCQVSKELTEADKARLLELKKMVLEASPASSPKPTSLQRTAP